MGTFRRTICRRVAATAVLCAVLGTLPAFAGPSVAGKDQGVYWTISRFTRGIVEGWLALLGTFAQAGEPTDLSSRDGVRPLTDTTGHVNDAGPVGDVESQAHESGHTADGGPVG